MAGLDVVVDHASVATVQRDIPPLAGEERGPNTRVYEAAKRLFSQVCGRGLCENRLTLGPYFDRRSMKRI